MRWVFGLFAVLALGAVAHAEIYKWVDKDGKVHYSDQPPPTQPPEEISRIKADKVDSEAQLAAAESQRAKAERIAQPASQDASATTDAPASGNAGSLDCGKAISNAKDWLDSMRDVGRANVKSGHLDEAEYNKALVEIEKLRRRLSDSECRSSSGKVRKFYECSSNINNHVAKCASENDYE
jgi:hypothetical protein